MITDYIRIEQVLEHIPDLKSCKKLIKNIKKMLAWSWYQMGLKKFKNSKYIKIKKGPIQPLTFKCFSNKSLKIC